LLGGEPLRALRAQVHLGAAQGSLHRAHALQGAWGRVLAQGQGQVATSGDMQVQATVQAQADPQATSNATTTLPHWSLALQAQGPLSQLNITAKLTTAATTPSKNGAPHLDAQAELAPFAVWPLTRLKMQWAGLDLSLFHASAPQTLLEGQVKWEVPRGQEPPTQAAAHTTPALITLRNRSPGLWNAGRLPLRGLELSAQWVKSGVKSGVNTTTPHGAQAQGRVRLDKLTMDLGSSEQNAGRISGQGEFGLDPWSDWVLNTEWQSVTPQALDARATPMRLSGPVQLSGQWPTQADRRTVQNTWQHMALQLQAQLRGAVLTTGEGASKNPLSEVRLQVDLQGQQQRWTLKRLEATAGASELKLQAQAEPSSSSPTAPWRLKAQAQLRDFDPALWWPAVVFALPAEANRSSRLQLDADMDVVWPRSVTATNATTPSAATTQTANFLTWASRLRGRAQVDLAPSTLAGVALQGQARWHHAASPSNLAPGADTKEFHALLDADGNRLTLSNNPTPSAPKASWQFKLDAPRLAQLSPWAAWLGIPAASPASPNAHKTPALAGALYAQGQWSPTPNQRPSSTSSSTSAPAPLLQALLTQGQSSGDAKAQQLRLGPWFVATGDVQWQGSLAAAAPLSLQAELQQTTGPSVNLQQLSLQLKGSSDTHELRMQAQSPLQAPAWMQSWLQVSGGVSAPPAKGNTAIHTVVKLQARGGLKRDVSGVVTGWQGQLTQWLLQNSNDNSIPWWRGSEVGLTLAWAKDSARAAATPGVFPLRVTLGAGRAELPGAALRWQQLFWQAATTTSPAQINMQAELEEVAVAPLLVRLQPDFGWGGDLRIAGRVNLRSQPTFEADVLLERVGGDLTVSEDGLIQTLGLSDLRLGLTASNGVWRFSQGLAGSTLGVAGGLVVARTSPTATWPTPDATLEGGIELQVANLGTWGTWVPAGWRLSGQLQSSAQLSGRWGAPEFTGQLKGQQLGVRNLVQGVSVSDGEVSLSLQGQQARIDHFSAKAGKGQVQLTGQASLGAKPQAELTLVAQQFQLLGRVDRRIVTSGQAQLRLTGDNLDLTGRFAVDEGLIDISQGDAPTLGSDVVVVRNKDERLPAAGELANNKPMSTAKRPTQRAVKLDLQVALGDKLRLRGRGLNTGLTGELKLTAPNNQLAIHGTVRTVGGTYDAYRQKLTIDKGQLTFTGPPDVARLDIEATRPNTDVRVGVAVTGTTVTPRVRLFSEPELPEIDKLSWLVLGRESGGLGSADTALLQRAALALLSGEEDSATDQLLRNIGIDDLSLRQSTSTGAITNSSAASGGEVRETIISLGKQLSSRWYVGYERSLNATAGNWQLIYRIAQRFTLRAQSGPENSLDLIWSWRWQ
jgi:translocation and assembly module TamB